MRKKRLHVCMTLLSMLAITALNAQLDSTAQKAGSPPTPPQNFNLLYKSQSRKTTTAAVGEIRGPELLKTISTSYAGWLSGRLAGVHTFQPIGEPGYDDILLAVRGQIPLVLFDGTPQSFPSFNPEQVESITVLKDAVSTAMLGMRGGNGAINITTKKGGEMGMHIEASALYGMSQPTRQPKFLSAADYARLYNEALANDGIAPIYTQADIDKYNDGSDPIGHPNVDWQDAILKDKAAYSRYDLSITGGNRTTKYFVNLNYLNQDGLLKEEGFNVYKTNSNYNRYMIRSNIEVDLTKYITTSLNLVGRIQNSNQPGSTTGTIFSNLLSTPNNAYPRVNTDGSLGGNLDYQSNIYGQAVLSGYMPVYERDFKADLSLRGNLDPLVKGLWVKGLVAINAYQRETINRSKTFAVYRENTDGGGNKTYAKFGTTGDQLNTIAPNSQNRLIYTEFSTGYSTQLNKKNHLEALLLGSNDYRMVNSDLAFSITTLAAKISFSNNDKYFVDLTAGYNGTERFPKENRYGLFPAIGLGWELTKESFLANHSSWLSYLKLRATFGKTGNANVGYYDYYQYYVTGTGYGFGATVPTTNTTLTQGTLANPSITWEKANKFSTGIDAGLFANKLTFSFDYFHDNYYDLVQSRDDGSNILGTNYVRENIGKNLFSGLELQATWKQTLGDFSYFISPNVSSIKSKVVYAAEPQRLYSYLQRTGRPVGQAFGYVAEGLFNTADEISSHAFQGGTIRVGDIKYKDLNNDGLIDGNDVQAIGSTKPFIYYGLNTGFTYKGIDLSILFQGVTNNNFQATGYRAFQNNGKGQAYEDQLNRWTPTNTTNASYPRLWVGTNVNNTLTSTYWLKNGDFLRLKNIELGFSLPSKFIHKANLSVARIFISATNLLTISKLNDLNIDPEGSAGGYPIMKTIMAGINIKL
jgi:TonB-linked SusC/RagA family outer membrane protein